MSLGLILTILFVILQWMEVIDWEWWQIILPILIELSIAAVSFLLFGAAAFKFWKD